LIEVVIGSLRLSEQEGYMFGDLLTKSTERPHGVLELVCKLLVFLISPGLAEISVTRHQGIHLFMHAVSESSKVSGETANFCGVNDCLGHRGILI